MRDIVTVARPGSSAAGISATACTIVAAVPESVSSDPRAPTSDDLHGRFTGQLVVVEPLAAEHEAGLITAADKPELFTWMPVDMASSDDAVRSWLSASLDSAAAGREVPFAICDAASGRVLGSTRFMELRLEHLRVEIGWSWLTSSAWSTGANVETKLLLLAHAFEQVGCRRVEFKTDARNGRSRGALLALGAVFEGVLRKHMVVRDGGPRDSAYFSVIDDEWPELKQRLERRRDEHVARRLADR
jgi:RimJ/RimL family protein N-acetyltransferase